MSAFLRVATASLLAFAALVAPAAALAAPPNDTWDTRIAISNLPFTDTQAGVQTAGEQATDAFFPCRVLGPNT